MNTRWGEGVWAALVALADRLATIGPAVFIMITLIVLGLLAGALLRAVVSRLARAIGFDRHRSEEHTSELQSRYVISYAVFCLTKKKKNFLDNLNNLNEKASTQKKHR